MSDQTVNPTNSALPIAAKRQLSLENEFLNAIDDALQVGAYRVSCQIVPLNPGEPLLTMWRLRITKVNPAELLALDYEDPTTSKLVDPIVNNVKQLDWYLADETQNSKSNISLEAQAEKLEIIKIWLNCNLVAQLKNTTSIKTIWRPQDYHPVAAALQPAHDRMAELIKTAVINGWNVTATKDHNASAELLSPVYRFNFESVNHFYEVENHPNNWAHGYPQAFNLYLTSNLASTEALTSFNEEDSARISTPHEAWTSSLDAELFYNLVSNPAIWDIPIATYQLSGKADDKYRFALFNHPSQLDEKQDQTNPVAMAKIQSL